MSAAISITPAAAKKGDSLVVTGSGIGSPVNSSLSTNLTGTHNDLVFTAKTPGAGGDAISITYVDSASNNVAFSVSVSSNDITVNLATDGSSAPTTTAAQIKAGIEASTPASALVSVALKSGNDGTGVATALSKTQLSGGTDSSLATILLYLISSGHTVKETVTVTAAGTFTTTGDFEYVLENSSPVIVRVTNTSNVVQVESTVQVFS